MARILHISRSPSFSGAEAYALETARASRDLFQHEVAFHALAGGPLAERIRAAQLEHVESLSSSELARFDIIHLHATRELTTSLALRLALLSARGRKPRVVLQTHIWIDHRKRDFWHRVKYSVVDEVWCSSEPARQTLVGNLPLAADRIRILRYGRDVHALTSGLLTRGQARARLGIPEELLVIGTVARVDAGKGTAELLWGTLPLLSEREDLALLMIGPATADDPKAVALNDTLDRNIAALPKNVRSRVFKQGYFPNSSEILRAFDLFILATYKECFALSVLEALLAEVPVAATNSGGSPEVVRPGETGWLFEPRSAPALTQTLRQALNEKSNWAKLGRTGRQLVLSEFDSRKIWHDVERAYRRLLGRLP